MTKRPNADINCVAAPIYDYRGQVIAAISTSWILEQQPQMTPEKMAPLVVKCATNISTNMGWNKKISSRA
ncbi:MAG: IclR family transcriptional regulator domain-containing protein [Sphaerochaeta sp.]